MTNKQKSVEKIIPQEIQDLMPETWKLDKLGARKGKGDTTDKSYAQGYNQALTEVEAVLPQIIELAERQRCEEMVENVWKCSADILEDIREFAGGTDSELDEYIKTQLQALIQTNNK